ncbi:hypothetical protein DRQ36_03300 [bacterium]|nr:MAG: hypothetical protein DRQ36_03300 [bacterium]
MLTILIVLLLVSLFADFKRKQYNRKLVKLQTASSEYYHYLNSLILGFGSNETARELCKAKQLWENASGFAEQFAAVQIADGAANIALSEVGEIIDTEAFTELTKQYRCHKNNVLWAIRLIMMTGKPRNSPETSGKFLDSGILDKLVTQAKIRLLVRYSHIMKPYPKPWEFYR